MDYSRLLPILAMATASACAGQQPNLSQHVGVVYDGAGQKVKAAQHNDKNDNHFSQENIDEILQSTVQIYTEIELTQKIGETDGGLDIKLSKKLTGTGSGVALCNNYVLTAEHNVPQTYNEMKVSNLIVAINNEYPAVVVKRENESDLALLSVDCKGCLTPYMGGFAETVEVGDFVAGAGFPLGGTVRLFKGHVSGRDVETQTPSSTLDIDTHIAPGDSGGLVVNYVNGK